jgi:hypothetical protein
MQSLFSQSLSALKTSPSSSLPLGELHNHQRNLAAGFISLFSKFAIEVCGCEDPDNRVKLRKAVWQQTMGLKLKDFDKASKDALHTISAMECPVQILARNVSAARDESSPSKIIMASKLLRSHSGINESTTCRGCSKRNRCPFVRKIVPNNSAKTTLGALTKVLFGMSQSCRLYLKDPEVYPFVLSAVDIEAAVHLTERLETFLHPSAIDRQLKNVSVADRKAVKAIVTRQIKKNQQLQEERDKAKRLGLPQEMVESRSSDQTVLTMKQMKGPKFDINSPEWVPEEKSDELSTEILKFDKNSDFSTDMSAGKQWTSIDNILNLPIPERYPEGRKMVKKSKAKPQSLVSLNKLGNGIDLTTVSGGYVVGDKQSMLPTTDGIEYIKPNLMRGKTVMDNVSLASKLWQNSSPYITELKFLNRVPFESTVKVPVDSKNRDVFPDVTLARVLSEKQPSSPPKSRPDARIKVHLLDKRVDLDHAGVTAASISNVNIVTASPASQSLAQSSSAWQSNDAAMAASGQACDKRGQGKLHEIETGVFVNSGLSFPKLPQWNPETIGKVEKGRTEKVRIGSDGAFGERLKVDFSKLMRPRVVVDNTKPALDVKDEIRKSEKALKKAAKRRPSSQPKLVPTTPADLAGVWKIPNS